MSRFKHIHSSSFYQRSPGTLFRAAKTYNADLVTYTEVQAENREDAVRRANGEEFGFVSGDKSYSNDCVISFKKERFWFLYRENFKSTDKTFFNTKGRERTPQYSTNVVLYDKKADKKLVVCVIHLPAGVEDDLAAKRNVRRTASWYATFRGSKKRANQLRKKYKADGILYVADFNIDFKKRWCRNLVKTLAPAYTLTWKNVNIKGGTHHNRIIDATLVRGKIKVRNSAKLYEDDNSSDHRPYVETLVWF